MSDAYTITGELVLVKEVMSFDSGFRKREIVVRTDGKYPQEIPLEIIKDNVDKITPAQQGSTITATFDLRGREWNGKHFSSLLAWKWEIEQGAGTQEQPPPSPQDDQTQNADSDQDAADSKLPF